MGSKNLIFLSSILQFLILSSGFTPQDNYLLNCGSAATASIVDGRRFVGDESDNAVDYLSQGKKSISVTDPRHPPNHLYSTARVFTSTSKYVFKIHTVGTHFLRLHFSPFNSSDFDLKNARFHVLANGFSLLNNFVTNSTVLKEFFFPVDGFELQIVFKPTPDSSSFAYVNAIEAFSAPRNFFIDAAAIALVRANGVEEEYRQNISTQVLETVHRINVGGARLTPFNDTLWRSWTPDGEFLLLASASKIATTAAPPHYQPGGATREDAPDAVYMTAREMDVPNLISAFMFNITWEFPVGRMDKIHLVRMHFCDIVSITLSTLYFNVYIDEVIAYKDLDLSVLAFHQLASPYYIDFVVERPRNSTAIKISIGPSELSSTMRKNAILNGVEIIRMLNSKPLPLTSTKRNVWIIVGSVVGGLFLLVVVMILIKCTRRKRKKKKKLPPQQRRAESTGWTSLHVYGDGGSSSLASPGPCEYYGLKIPFTDIQTATNNFDNNLIIGSGGFGMVYKGILKDNVKVAVKRGVPGSRQGLPEFQTEITILSRIRHRHLVSLVGYCEEQSEMVLVYEYMEKGPLRHHLYGTNFPVLSWKQRLEICIGAARGLHYLHTGSAQGIIHRDIKSTNILLDNKFVAKVADFGLSKSGPCLDESHVSTGVKGSFGYLDPEYFRRQQLTDKSDVYSFGVVLFEVLCARPAVDPLLDREQVNLAEWAMEWQRKGMIEQIVDRRVADQIKLACLKKFGGTAEKCLAEYGVDRPTMGDVLWNLEHAYQLQTSETGDVPDGACDDHGAPSGVPPPDLDEAAGDYSDMSATRVFSQLMKSEGR